MKKGELSILKKFKGLVLDADGVLFDGKESRSYCPDTGALTITKTRDLRDGQGLSFLRAIGIRILFASGEGEPLGSIVKKLNDLPSVHNNSWDPIEAFVGVNAQGSKRQKIEVWLSKHDLKWEECVYIGDDSTDYDAMQKAGLKVAPATATRLIKRIADLVLTKPGGNGCIREFAEMVLDARGIDEATLPFT